MQFPRKHRCRLWSLLALTKTARARRMPSLGVCFDGRHGTTSMSRLRRTVYGKLELPDFRQLKQEAAARGVTLTACVADCLREYFALRQEMATAVTTAGE